MSQKIAKPQDMKKSFRASAKQFVNPKSTRFLASNRSTRGLGFFGGISKTQISARKAQKEVLGKQTAFNIARTSFKQQAYKDALATKLAKVASTGSPFGVRTSLFSRSPKSKQEKAQKKIAVLRSKVAKYNAAANSAIKQLATTNLGKATLQRTAEGTLVQKSLTGAMNELKKAYNSKRTGTVDAQKTELAQIIKTKQGLDNAVFSAKAAVFKSSTPETKKALQAALAAKETFKTTEDAKKIPTLIKALKKTNKISQIKFNNLYAVSKGTLRGEKLQEQAKRDVLTMKNSAKQLKREAKYSSFSKVANLSFYQKYIKGKPLYTSEEGQTKLKSIVDEAAALKERLKSYQRGPTSSETKILKRSLKAEAILRTLGRTRITADNGTQKNLLKVPISAEILKSPLTKYGTDITAKKAIIDEAKIKANNAEVKQKANKEKITSLDTDKKALEANKLELGNTKTQLAEKMKLYVPEELTKQKADLESKTPRDEAAIKAIDEQIAIKIAALTPEQQKEHTELENKINLNENNIKTNTDSIASIDAQKISLEAENKIHDETIKTHTKLESDYKVEDANIKLAANKEIIAGYDGQTKDLEAKLALASTTPEEAKYIQKQIDDIGIEKGKLEAENQEHEKIITPPAVVVPAVVVPKAPQTTEEKRAELMAQLAALPPAAPVAPAPAPVVEKTAAEIAPAAPPVAPVAPVPAPAALVVEKTAAEIAAAAPPAAPVVEKTETQPVTVNSSTGRVLSPT